MKIVHKKRIFIIFIFVLTLSLSGIFIYNHFNVDIDKVLETEEYSYLPDEAKEYVKDAFEATGEVIPTEKNKKENQVYLNPSYIKYLQLISTHRKNISNITMPILRIFSKISSYYPIALNIFLRVICEISVRFFFPHANPANLAKVYFITFKLL